MLKVHSIESFGTHEWPWIRFVLFLQWCMFKCLYCHNPDTIAMSGWKEISTNDIVSQVINMKSYFNHGKWWFTVSWWEPLLQAKDLIPLFELLKKEWINIAVDTNGFPWNDDVKKAVDLADLFLVDIKHINNDWHKKLTGQSNDNTLRFIYYLESQNKAMWIRVVLVPWWSDQLENLEEIGKRYWWYKSIERIEILP